MYRSSKYAFYTNLVRKNGIVFFSPEKFFLDKMQLTIETILSFVIFIIWRAHISVPLYYEYRYNRLQEDIERDATNNKGQNQRKNDRAQTLTGDQK